MNGALAAKANRLRALHRSGAPLILPNAWDVPSALAVERAGAAAVATTSSGVAAAIGYPDGEAIPAEEMLLAVRRIAAAVEVPVTADLEAGYGMPPDELVARMLEAGAVGMNLEDTARDGGEPILGPMERQAERIAAVRAAAGEAGVPIVVNARIDTFLRRGGGPDEQVEDGLRRAHAYAAAGADCVYPIWLVEPGAIRRFVDEVAASVNILLRPGSPGVSELAAWGVQRISVGGGLAKHAGARIEELARRLLAGDGDAFGRIVDGGDS